MLFNSYIFILFFLPLTLALYYGLNYIKQYEPAKAVLIFASLIFYGCDEIRYVPIILSSILINYLLYCLLRRVTTGRKILLFAGVAANILLLGYFKYFDFLLENLNRFCGSSFDLLHIALPLGISFFTFQQVSFLVDASRGECSCKSFTDYCLFVTFFPQLVAGPIVSHDEMLPQFESKNNKLPNSQNISSGIQAFSMGLFKKVLIADNFGRIVSYGFGNIETLTSFEAALTILSYTIQIYYDFSGYCDMATGIGLLFNINLPVNFNSPYKATNIVAFWKRWHITLTRFLTKYVYIPLGGNKKGVRRTFINIFLVFLISGFWHGAGYTFIVWGILHGIANIFCRRYTTFLQRIPKWINWTANFAFLNLTWVIFRAESLNQAFQLMGRLFAGGFGISDQLRYEMIQITILDLCNRIIPLRLLLMAAVLLAVAHCVFSKNTSECIREHKVSLGNLLFCLVMFLVSVLSLSGVSTFLYFNF